MSGFIDQAPQTTPANFYVAPQPQPSNPGAQGLSDYTQALIAKQPQQMTFQQQLEAGQQIAKNNIDIKNAQMTQQANIAIGQAIQNATDPDTGEVDYQQALAHAAMNPQATFGMNDFVSTAIANGKVTADTVKTTLDNQLTKLGAVNNEFASLTSNPNLGVSDITPDASQGLNTLIKGGFVSSDEAATELQQLSSMTPAQQKQFIIQRAQMSQAAGATLQQNYGTLGLTNAGGTIQPTSTGGLGAGAGTPSGQQPPVVMTPTTAELNAGQNLQTGTGATVASTAVATRPMVDGEGNPINPGVKSAQITLDPQDQYVVGPYQQQVTQDAQSAIPLLTNLQKMQQLQTQFTSGKNTQARNALAAQAQAAGAPPAVVQGLAGGDLSAFQEYQKYQLIASGQLLMQNSRGAITNDEFQSYKNAVLGSDITPKALDDMTKQMIKVQRLPVIHQQFLQGYLKNEVPKGAKAGDEPSLWTQWAQKHGYGDGTFPTSLPQVPRASQDQSQGGGQGSVPSSDDTSPPPGIAP